MKELRIQIPQHQEELVIKLVQQLGGSVITDHLPKYTKMKRIESEDENAEVVSPTFLFGKWADLEIDAEKIREEAWRRKQKF